MHRIEIQCSTCGQRAVRNSSSKHPGLCQKCSRALLTIENVDNIRAAKKKWNDANPELNAELKRAYRQANLKRHCATNRAYNKSNPEVTKRACEKFYANHPARVKATAHRRRVQKIASLGGSFTPQEWSALIVRQKGKCYDCGTILNKQLTVGHGVPLSRGGSNHISNIIGQCQRCNSSQGTRIHADFQFSLFDKPIMT